MLGAPLAEKGLAPLDGGPSPNRRTWVFGKHVQKMAVHVNGCKDGTHCSNYTINHLVPEL